MIKSLLSVKKRGLVLLLTISLLLTALPVIIFQTKAAPEGEGVKGNISSVTESTFNELKLNADPASVLQEIENGRPPTKTEPFAIATISELAVSKNTTGYSIYDIPANSHGLPLATKNATIVNSKHFARSSAFDPVGNAKKEYLAEISAYNTKTTNGETASMFLTVSNANTSKYARVELQCFDAYFQSLNAGAFLAITTGDYDGDNCDEIAVYTRKKRVLNINPMLIELPYAVIRIYKYDPGTNKLTAVKEKLITALSTQVEALLGSNAKLYEYLSVNLTTIPAVGNACDVIAVTTSYIRGAEKTSINSDSIKNTRKKKLSSSSIAFWYNPLSDGSDSEQAEKITVEPLQDAWTSYGHTNTQNYEIMMFPSAASGDITGDGIPEVVVAGYRIANPDKDDLDDRDLDKNCFLVTYYALESESGLFKKKTLMQWVSLKNGDFNNAIDLGAGFFNGYNETDYAQNPLPITVFAERGKGYNNSVFVNGYILALPNISEGSVEETQQGMYNGSQAKPVNELLHPAAISELFRIRYAAPLYLPEQSEGTEHNRTITEVVSGNFDNNPMGREQIAFIYLVKREVVSKYDSWLCFLYLSGQSEDTVTNNNDKKYPLNVTFWSSKQHTNVETPFATVAAPDIDDDSQIFKYNPSKDPDFYFTDPKVIAVLQAAPYYRELSYTASDGEPSTQLTKTKGSVESSEHAVEVSVGAFIGADISGSIGLIANLELVDIEIGATLDFAAGWKHETEYVHSVSKSYTTGISDSVVLAMAPYIRYYYDYWNPDLKKWESTFIDTPLNPRTSQISVDMYDNVARMNNWKTLRSTALFDSEAGDPATYIQTEPESWNITDKNYNHTNQELNEWASVGFGSGSQTLTVSHERTSSHGATWGTSIGGEARGKIAAVKVGVQGSISYTGGYMWGLFESAEYSGTVPSVPEIYSSKYSFDWQFGTYFVDLFPNENKGLLETLDKTDQDDAADLITEKGLDCLVLGYRVRNIKAPPNAPRDLIVDKTTKNSVKLKWSPVKGKSIQYYEIAMVSGDVYYCLDVLDADKIQDGFYTYTDSKCEPGQVYQYVVRSYGFSGGFLMASMWSLPVYGLTSGEGEITLQPRDCTVRQGQTARFETAVSLPSNASHPNYQWQEKEKDNWVDINFASATNAIFNIPDVTNEMHGKEYRCKITVRIGGNLPFPMYTESARIFLGKGATVITTEISAEKGLAQSVYNEKYITNESFEYSAPLQAWIGDNLYQVLTDDSDNYYLYLDGSYYTFDGQIPDFTQKIQTDAAYEPIIIEGLSNPEVIEYETHFYEMESQDKFTDFDAGIINTMPVKATGNFTYDGSQLEEISYNIYSPSEGEYAGKVLWQFEPYSLFELDEENIISGYLYFDITGLVPLPDDLTDLTALLLGSPEYSGGFDPAELETALADAQGPAFDMREKIVPGDEVKFTVTVKENVPSGGLIPTGTVILDVFNKSTNNIVSTSNLVLVNGKATFTFVAPFAGYFEFRVRYLGNDKLSDSSAAFDSYYAYQNTSVDWLSIDVEKTTIVYGESLNFNPRIYSCDGENAPDVSSVTATYNVTHAGFVIDPVLDLDSWMSGDVFTPKKAGIYKVQISADGHVLNITVFVLTRTLKITAPTLILGIGELESFNSIKPEITGMLEADEDFLANMFSLMVDLPTGVTSVTSLLLGTYTISIAYLPDYYSNLKEFGEKYTIESSKGMLTIDPVLYRVNYRSGENGVLTPKTESGLPLSSGNFVAYGTVIQFSATPQPGYKVLKWDVKIDGQPVAYEPEKLNIEVTATENVDVTVTFVSVDTTAPTGKITIEQNDWSSFLNEITFNLFFKKTRTVTISASDDNGGEVDIAYYLSEEALSEQEAGALEAGDWTPYINPFKLEEGKTIIYAKLKDEFGNYKIIGSNGVVVYIDSEQDTSNISYTKASTEDVMAFVTLNGNTVAGIFDGSNDLVPETDYSVNNTTGAITLKASFLDSQDAGSYELTVSYNPRGLTISEGSEAPAKTSISLTVARADFTAEVTLEDWIRGETVPSPNVSANPGSGDVNYYYDTAAEGPFTSQDIPELPGAYYIKAVISQTESYNSYTTAAVKFTIYPDAITSPVFSVNTVQISKIEPDTTVRQLMQDLNESKYCKVYNGDKELTDNDLVATGMTVKLLIKGKTVKSVTAIVTGDISKDGKSTITDLLAVKSHILNKTPLTEFSLKAADTNGDHKVTVTDFIQIKSHILGREKIRGQIQN